MITPLFCEGLVNSAPLLGFLLVPRIFVPRNPPLAYAARMMELYGMRLFPGITVVSCQRPNFDAFSER